MTLIRRCSRCGVEFSIRTRDIKKPFDAFMCKACLRKS